MVELLDSESDAEEVFALVDESIRVSRDARAKWIFDSILVNSRLVDSDTIQVIGQTPSVLKKDKISEHAEIVFIFQRYRYVFIFDLSASGTGKMKTYPLRAKNCVIKIM